MTKRDDSLNLHDILEEFKWYVPYHIRNARVVMVPRGFVERVNVILLSNGITPEPPFRLDGRRLLVVESRGESDGRQ